jgi:tRNA splicing ligase
MARGLFINPNTEKVVCRGYEKFFSWGETERNKTENLIKSLKFPVFAYKKENGFLALVSYKEEDDNLLVCSKSVDSGAYVDMITEELNKLSKETLEYIKNFCKDNRVTFVFECINQDKDPHIIEYSQNKLVLLDIIQNSLQFEKFSYNRVKEISDKIKIECKKLLYTFDNFKELYNFKKEQDNSFDVKYEGRVLEDSENYMLKYKTRYYKFWKQMRSVKERVQKHQQLNKTYVNTDEVKILNLMQHLDHAGVLKDLSIIDVEKIYHKQTEELA